MKEKKKSSVAILLDYAGSHKGLTFLGLALSAVSMLLSMVPYLCIWLVARDLIAVAPDWTRAQSITQYLSLIHIWTCPRPTRFWPSARPWASGFSPARTRPIQMCIRDRIL